MPDPLLKAYVQEPPRFLKPHTVALLSFFGLYHHKVIVTDGKNELVAEVFAHPNDAERMADAARDAITAQKATRIDEWRLCDTSMRHYCFNQWWREVENGKTRRNTYDRAKISPDLCKY